VILISDPLAVSLVTMVSALAWSAVCQKTIKIATTANKAAYIGLNLSMLRILNLSFPLFFCAELEILNFWVPFFSSMAGLLSTKLKFLLEDWADMAYLAPGERVIKFVRYRSSLL
jgi:hypothetical protein